MINIKLLQEYNDILLKFKMAQIYLDSDKVEDSEKDKWINKFLTIVSDIDKKQKQIEEAGIEYTKVEKMEGFHIEFREARYKKYGL